MNKFEKFMVVPYKQKEEELTAETKISQILNNNNLNTSDKTKLIDQLLIQNSNNNETIKVEPEPQSKVLDQVQKEEKTKTKQKKLDYYYDIDEVNERLNKLKGTKNNAQLFLNPAASTRKNTKKIKDKIDVSINQIIKLNKSLKTKAPKKSRTKKIFNKSSPSKSNNLNETIKDNKPEDQSIYDSFSEENQPQINLLDWEKYGK